MPKTPSVAEIRAFTYLVLTGNEPSISQPVGRLNIEEHKAANSRGGLIETVAEYAFKLTDNEGAVVAYIAPGYWPYIKKVIEASAPLHSPACEEDCITEISALTVIPGAED